MIDHIYNLKNKTHRFSLKDLVITQFIEHSKMIIGFKSLLFC
jgi:hypothetical protein